MQQEKVFRNIDELSNGLGSILHNSMFWGVFLGLQPSRCNKRKFSETLTSFQITLEKQRLTHTCVNGCSETGQSCGESKINTAASRSVHTPPLKSLQMRFGIYPTWYFKWFLLLHFQWVETFLDKVKLCPFSQLHFVENLNGKSPVLALPSLRCEFDMKFRRILSEMQKIPNVQPGDVYCAAGGEPAFPFQQKVFQFLSSYHPARLSAWNQPTFFYIGFEIFKYIPAFNEG